VIGRAIFSLLFHYQMSSLLLFSKIEQQAELNSEAQNIQN
jgi:hypothetical protein